MFHLFHFQSKWTRTPQRWKIDCPTLMTLMHSVFAARYILRQKTYVISKKWINNPWCQRGWPPDVPDPRVQPLRRTITWKNKNCTRFSVVWWWSHFSKLNSNLSFVSCKSTLVTLLKKCLWNFFLYIYRVAHKKVLIRLSFVTLKTEQLNQN